MYQKNKQILCIKSLSDNFSEKNFEDKYILSNNFMPKNEPTEIQETEEIYNRSYHIAIIVLRGKLNIRINDCNLCIGKGEYLRITPFTRIKINKSMCCLFVHQITTHLISDIFDRLKYRPDIRMFYFSFYHTHLNQKQLSYLKDNHQKMEYVIKKEKFLLQEFALRGYAAIHIILGREAFKAQGEINHITPSQRDTIYNSFLDLLNEHYQTERSVKFYADKLNVTPKYLSSITYAINGNTASKIIDEFVILQITTMLYKNDCQIKDVSDKFNFPSQSFFGRYFKRITGICPREFIQQKSVKLSR